jgi:hypothetical protein
MPPLRVVTVAVATVTATLQGAAVPKKRWQAAYLAGAPSLSKKLARLAELSEEIPLSPAEEARLDAAIRRCCEVIRPLSEAYRTETEQTETEQWETEPAAAADCLTPPPGGSNGSWKAARPPTKRRGSSGSTGKRPAGTPKKSRRVRLCHRRAIAA